MKNPQDVNSTIFDLRKRGYRLDFIFLSNSIFCVPLRLKINLSDIEIVETYKFPSRDNSGKLNILCAIKCNGGQRGILYEVSDRVFELFELVRPKANLSVNDNEKQSKRFIPSKRVLVTNDNY